MADHFFLFMFYYPFIWPVRTSGLFSANMLLMPGSGERSLFCLFPDALFIIASTCRSIYQSYSGCHWGRFSVTPGLCFNENHPQYQREPSPVSTVPVRPDFFYIPSFFIPLDFSLHSEIAIKIRSIYHAALSGMYAVRLHLKRAGSRRSSRRFLL